MFFFKMAIPGEPGLAGPSFPFSIYPNLCSVHSVRTDLNCTQDHPAKSSFLGYPLSPVPLTSIVIQHMTQYLTSEVPNDLNPSFVIAKPTDTNSNREQTRI